jgi:hypothetical protein
VLVLVVAEHRHGIGREAPDEIGGPCLATGRRRLEERGPACDVARGNQGDRVGWHSRDGVGCRRHGRGSWLRRERRRLRLRDHLDAQPPPDDQAPRPCRKRVAAGRRSWWDPDPHPEPSPATRAKPRNPPAREGQAHPRCRREVVPGHRHPRARRDNRPRN